MPKSNERVRVMVMLDYKPNLASYPGMVTTEEAAESDLKDLRDGLILLDEFFDDERTVITAVVVHADGDTVPVETEDSNLSEQNL